MQNNEKLTVKMNVLKEVLKSVIIISENKWVMKGVLHICL